MWGKKLVSVSIARTRMSATAAPDGVLGAGQGGQNGLLSEESIEIGLLDGDLAAGHSEGIHNTGTVKYRNSVVENCGLVLFRTQPWALKRAASSCPIALSVIVGNLKWSWTRADNDKAADAPVSSSIQQSTSTCPSITLQPRYFFNLS